MPNGEVVHPTPVTAWQLIAGVVAVMVTMAAALWTILSYENSNNKTIVDDLHTNYTTTREHTDVKRELDRIGNKLDNDALPRKEFEAWKKERDVTVDQIKLRLDRIEQMHLSRMEFEGRLNEVKRYMDTIKKDLDRLDDRESARHTIAPQRPSTTNQ